MSNACVTSKHPEQPLCLHTGSIKATPPTMAECYTVLADAAQLPGAAARQLGTVTKADGPWGKPQVVSSKHSQ